MIVDLSCPIELRGYEILHDDNGNARAYIWLNNLSKRAVVGYSATANWFNAATQMNMLSQLDVDDCVIPARSEFKLMLTAPRFPSADYVELYFSSVALDGGEVYAPSDGALVDIGEQPVLKGGDLDALKALAGEDAVQFPQVRSDFWRCVCGRINTLDTEICARCARLRGDVLKRFNAKAVRSSGHFTRRARPEKVNVKRAARMRDKALKGILIALIVLFLAIVGYEIGRIDARKLLNEQSTDIPMWISPDYARDV